MDFSNAYVDTEVDHIDVGIQPQGLAEEAEVAVVSRATRRRMTILCRIAQWRSGIRGIYYHKTSNDVADLYRLFQLCIIQDQRNRIYFKPA
jgi:hypothetical protein